MPIGRFARAVRLSVKALRHYDEEGLLRPGYVDPRTGYRYYGREQARDALMIAMLRSLELPLETVRAALAATPAELSALIARERARLAGELERRRSALRALERIAGAGKLAPYEIAVRDEPAQLVARLTNATTAESLVADSTGWVFEVMAEVERAGRPRRRRRGSAARAPSSCPLRPARSRPTAARTRSSASRTTRSSRGRRSAGTRRPARSARST